MNKIPFLFLLVFIFLPSISFSQIFYSDGSIITINNGAIVLCNGGMQLTNSTLLSNDGDVKITKNSVLPSAGNFNISSLSIVNGNGKYQVEQDWINDAQFNAQNSQVTLYGNTEQKITSTNGTISEFNILTLIGNGTGLDRKKTLLNADSRVSALGQLQLNDRELATETNTFYVLNPDINSISNNTVFGNEGFVSSLPPGYLVRETNSQADYLFPVGSSDGTTRYRSVVMTPLSSSDHTYAVRFNNYIADTDGYPLAQHENIIDQANTNYYHSIERINGTSNANIGINYLPSDDGTWTGIAHWYNSNAQWKSMGNSNQTAFGNYTNMEKVEWDFPDASTPYVLKNLVDLVIVPTAFTPDGDEVNEFWEIPNLDAIYPNNVVRIYNRWGSLLYENDAQVDGSYLTNQWDGKYNNEEMPVGSYYFIIDFNDADKNSKTGTVSIIKDEK